MGFKSKEVVSKRSMPHAECDGCRAEFMVNSFSETPPGWLYWPPRPEACSFILCKECAQEALYEYTRAK